MVDWLAYWPAGSTLFATMFWFGSSCYDDQCAAIFIAPMQIMHRVSQFDFWVAYNKYVVTMIKYHQHLLTITKYRQPWTIMTNLSLFKIVHHYPLFLEGNRSQLFKYHQPTRLVKYDILIFNDYQIITHFRTSLIIIVYNHTTIFKYWAICRVVDKYFSR